MLACRKVQGLIAASIYEPLAAAERAYLEAHTARCAACREQASVLPNIVAMIPLKEAHFTGDLLPALRAQLGREVRRLAQWRRWYVAAGAVAMCVILAGVYTIVEHGGGSRNDAPTAVASTLASTLEAAKALRAKNDLSRAMQMLQSAVATHPSDPQAGEAQLLVADLLFSDFQQYPQAYEAYRALRERYPQTFLDSAAPVKERFGLLDEARAQGYASLNDLDRARNVSGDKFASLEEVVACYPDTYVAALAVDDMVGQVVGAKPDGAGLQTAALEQVRSRCQHPVAVAQVNMLLGDRYLSYEHDQERARAAYEEVVAHGPEVLAAKAETALTQLAASF